MKRAIENFGAQVNRVPIDVTIRDNKCDVVLTADRTCERITS
jgi:hypothetical protein